jgi:hypothetical protein
MHNIDPRWDRSNDPTPIEPRPDAGGKTVPPAPTNGLARRLDLGVLFTGHEDRLTEVADLFWSKVDVDGKNECHIWTGKEGPGGYGQVRFRLGGRLRLLSARRFAYALEHPDQAIPEGVQVTHCCGEKRRCGEKLCVNPRHLYLADRRGRPLSSAGNGLTRFEDRLP